MKIPEFPELSHRQADTIIAIVFVIGFIIGLPIVIFVTHLTDHQFYVSHKQECLSHNGNWREEKNWKGEFSWSCNYEEVK